MNLGIQGVTVFALCVARAPEGAPLKSKMIYASSKDAIKKKFTGKLFVYLRYICIIDNYFA